MDTSYYTSSSFGAVPQGDLACIKYIVIDVDGTMTDGGIYYDELGNESKKFSTKDAAGFFAAKICGIKTIVLTGRECAATEKRMKELQVDCLYQDVKDKVSFLKKFMESNCIGRSDIAYIGDDLNDYQAMNMVGYIGCPSNAAEEILKIANYISIKKGGEGAVRDVICHVLKERRQWKEAMSISYHIGV